MLDLFARLATSGLIALFWFIAAGCAGGGCAVFLRTGEAESYALGAGAVGAVVAFVFTWIQVGIQRRRNEEFGRWGPPPGKTG